MSTQTITPPMAIHWTRIHPFVVWGPHGFEGRFSDLRCAAKTAVYLGESGGECWVIDQRTGQEWRGEELRQEVVG